MNLVLLIIFTLLAYILLTFCRRWHDFFVLMAVSIGCAVNADVYSSFANPVMVGNIYLSIDSVLYSLFAFTLIIALRDYGLKDFKTMAYSALIAIIISSFIELFAVSSTIGELTKENIFIFLSKAISALGSLVGVSLAVLIYQKLKAKNVSIYVIFLLLISELCLVQAIFYYSGIAILGVRTLDDIWFRILGSTIIKIVCIGLGCISYYINHRWWYSKNRTIDKA